MLCYSREVQRVTNIDRSPDGPWIVDPLGTLRDGGAFNEVKVLSREGHNYIADTALSAHGTKRRNTCRDAGRTPEIFLDPILVYALGQNNDPALNMPRDDGLSGGDSQVGGNLYDLKKRISEPSVDSSQLGLDLLRSAIRGFP